MPRMGLNRITRRIATWLAVLAVSLNALWPLVANAKPVGAFDPSSEICTVGGIKTFAGGGALPQPADNAHQPDCSFCTLGADKFVLPSAGVAHVPAMSRGPDFQAATAALPPAAPFRHSPAHPRAPPVLS
jgi:hypothetical protein